MCKTYTIYCRICNGIYASNTEYCKDYDRCGGLTKFYRYASRQCPDCNAKDEELSRQKWEKARVDTANKGVEGGRSQAIDEEGAEVPMATEDPFAPSTSRLKTGPTSRTEALRSHEELLRNEEPPRRRRSRTIRPDTITIETYSPPPSPKCIPMDGWNGGYTSIVPETPAAFEQLFALVHPGWDGVPQRRKRTDTEKARKV
ncbi:hypothetical protein MMC30_007997 [Trapelia coarctata]|nr:hypothetical protein [Trapelia coarctata]